LAELSEKLLSQTAVVKFLEAIAMAAIIPCSLQQIAPAGILSDPKNDLKVSKR
jgi:hypothetical protein